MIELPYLLQDAIKSASKQVSHNEQGDLWLGHRRIIYRSFGEVYDPSTKEGDHLAYSCRIALAVRTVERVMPIWQRAFADNSQPGQLLEAATQMQQGVLDLSQTAELAASSWIDMDDMSSRYPQSHKSHNALMVGYAAVHALYVAIGDESFSDDVERTLTEADVDPYEFDAAGVAAMAWADGPVWVETSNTEKRREFWKWWLNDTIPAAWRSVQEQSPQ